MRSYDVTEFGAPLRRFDRPTPTPTGSEVLLRTCAAGVCHTDLHIAEGGYDLGQGKMLRMADRGLCLPHTMGHETVGEVVAVGPQATGVAIGDRRLVYPWIGCGTCAQCVAGDEHLCTAPRFLGVFRNGGYSDHIIVPHPRYLLDIGDLPAEQAAPLACSGLTAFAALKKIGAAITSQPIVIIGAGGLGLMCLSLLRALGGKGAVVVDIDPAKLQSARNAGALAAVNGSAPDAAAQVVQAVGGPIIAVIDFVGSPSSARLGIDVVGKNGKYVIVGLFGGDITLSLPVIPLRSISIVGSFVGSLADLRELVDVAKTQHLQELPVSVRRLDEANDALADLKAGKVTGRAILVP